MIDPSRFTNYNRTEYELQEALLFCIAVAGKNAMTTARNLDRFLAVVIGGKKGKPFDAVAGIGLHKLTTILKTMGFGCYNLKATGFHYIANSGLNLKTCTVEDLEKCPGIGPKTARFFILHTRDNAQMACLDTHICSFLREVGFDAPKSSPQSKSKYSSLERVFLKIAKLVEIKPSDLDLFLWRFYSGNANEEDTMDRFLSIKRIASEYSQS